MPSIHSTDVSGKSDRTVNQIDMIWRKLWVFLSLTSTYPCRSMTGNTQLCFTIPDHVAYIRKQGDMFVRLPPYRLKIKVKLYIVLCLLQHLHQSYWLREVSFLWECHDQILNSINVGFINTIFTKFLETLKTPFIPAWKERELSLSLSLYIRVSASELPRVESSNARGLLPEQI